MTLRTDDRAEGPGPPGSWTRDLRTHLERPAVRWTLLSVAGLLLLNLVAALVLFGLQRSHVDAVLSGVEVDGEPVGGLDRSHLGEVVRSRADDRLAQPVRITTATPGTELETDRAAIGVAVDVERAADDAWQQGRRGLWRALADQVRVRLGATLSVPLHLEVDDDHLDDWSAQAADELSREPRSAAIELVPADDADGGEASVEVTTEQDGLEVAPAVLAEQVRDHLTPLGPAHVEVPAEATTAEVTDADVEAVVDDAELAVSAPVELANPSPADDVVLTPTDLAGVLVVDADLDAPEGERLRITSDGQRLGAHLGDDRVDELGPGAVEATLHLDEGTAVIEGGTDGFELDLDAAAELVVELATQDEPRAGELPGETTSPELTAEDAERALPDAQVLISDAVVLTNPSAAPDLELSPADLAAVLQVELDAEAISAAGEAEGGDEDGDGGGSLVRATTSGEVLTDHLGEDGVAELETAPVDLEVAAVDGELVVEGGTPGFAFDADAAAEVVVELASQSSDRTAELPGAVTQPDPSRESLQAAGITEVVSSFTTSLVPGQARNTNIQRAADFIDGDIIEPGATYSLNQGIGQRTADSGFVENGFIRDGEVISVTGGGVSQMGTTFMNAAWFAGIQIHEFHPHSLYFQRYPEGREATLSWGTLDVVVENDSPHSIMILTSHTDSSVTVSFASTSWAEVDTWTGERTNIVEGEVRDGFDITFGRDITYPDGSTNSETYSHRYQPEFES